MTRTVYVVPHCHWDREWYQPHELFRWRLVQMIDELLDYMERHPEYVCFNLDGQTIVIEDYLELRPENEGRLRALIEAGRIVIGPWLVQPDEFLPSGESHIRSMQRGIRYAERLGGSLMIGHCADQFGHIAQMPQIMAQLGLTSACLWRGVPDSVPVRGCRCSTCATAIPAGGGCRRIQTTSSSACSARKRRGGPTSRLCS
jgi:alpha-mannosidase